MNDLPSHEAGSRLKRLQQTITEMQSDACIITSSVNQYWLCGFIFDGFIFLFPEGEPILFVKRPFNIRDERAKQIRKPEQIPDMLRENGKPLPERILI
ncbi:MAG: aminopeptidase P family N-terminal domain-containing protein, partial [Proteiniphilum sp.]